MSDTIFADGQATPSSDAALPATPALPEGLDGIVGEGKKYATVQDALRSIPHAQAHIAKLESEARAKDEAIAKARALEEVYEALTSNRQASADLLPQAGFDAATLDVVLEQKLKEREASQKRIENIKTVEAAIKGKYGDKAQDVVVEKAKELGVSTKFIEDIVAYSPKAGLELFGFKDEKAAPQSASPAGNVNTLALPQKPDAPQVPPFMRGKQSATLLEQWNAAKPQG